jgi:hypothetical protein
MQMTTSMALAAAALLLAVEPSMACRDPRSGTSTVLDALPAAALLEEVIARVEVIELLRPPWIIVDDWKYTPMIRVRVVEAIKGVHEGQIFTLQTGGTSCDDAFPRNEPKFEAYAINWHPYVAGRLERAGSGEPIFRGAWKRDVKTGELHRAQ